VTTPAPAPNPLPDDEHNRALVAAVHPPGWVNPTPAKRYDLVVVGAGTRPGVSGRGGRARRSRRVDRAPPARRRLPQLRLRPVEGAAAFGAAAHDARSAAAFGVRGAGGVETDFGAVMRRLRRLRATIAPHDSAARFASLGVDVFLGSAAFVDGDTIAVAGQSLGFKRAIVATGARPATLPVPGLGAAIASPTRQSSRSPSAPIGSS